MYHEHMTPEEHHTHYASYLLRLRLVGSGEQSVWTASIEDTATGSRHTFPDVEALATFLLAEYGEHRAVLSEGVSVEPAGKSVANQQ